MRRPLFDVSVPYIGQRELMDGIASGKRYQLVTLNPEIMLEAHRNGHFKAVLNSCTAAVIDGTGLALMLKLLGYASPPRATGAALSVVLIRSGLPCFLLGGLNGEATAARDWIVHRWPEAHIVGAESGGKLSRTNPEINEGLLNRIAKSKATVLLIGFGAPRQELWMNKTFSRLGSVQVAVGVGGSLGFFSQKKRAPALWRRLGLEWAYRGVVEQHHWARVFQAVIVFPVTALLWQIPIVWRLLRLLSSPRKKP